jgi:hypothetical protein
VRGSLEETHGGSRPVLTEVMEATLMATRGKVALGGLQSRLLDKKQGYRVRKFSPHRIEPLCGGKGSPATEWFGLVTRCCSRSPDLVPAQMEMGW